MKHARGHAREQRLGHAAHTDCAPRDACMRVVIRVRTCERDCVRHARARTTLQGERSSRRERRARWRRGGTERTAQRAAGRAAPRSPPRDPHCALPSLPAARRAAQAVAGLPLCTSRVVRLAIRFAALVAGARARRLRHAAGLHGLPDRARPTQRARTQTAGVRALRTRTRSKPPPRDDRDGDRAATSPPPQAPHGSALKRRATHEETCDFAVLRDLAGRAFIASHDSAILWACVGASSGSPCRN
jgi:hypothetical protein